ncbi:MAG: hypothetical protein PVF43_05825, partial [Candidatus Eiseniibacteriota bacterium]
MLPYRACPTVANPRPIHPGRRGTAPSGRRGHAARQLAVGGRTVGGRTLAAVALLALVALGMLLPIAAVARSAEPHPTDEPGSLPIGLTDEERGRLDEIGQEHRSTPPPPAPARNCAEWEPVLGVLIRYPLGLPYDLVRDYSEHMMVYVLVSSSYQAQAESSFTSQGVNMANVEFLIMST